MWRYSAAELVVGINQNEGMALCVVGAGAQPAGVVVVVAVPVVAVTAGVGCTRATSIGVMAAIPAWAARSVAAAPAATESPRLMSARREIPRSRSESCRDVSGIVTSLWCKDSAAQMTAEVGGSKKTGLDHHNTVSIMFCQPGSIICGLQTYLVRRSTIRSHRHDNLYAARLESIHQLTGQSRTRTNDAGMSLPRNLLRFSMRS
jgi:hypothetical protein